MKIKILLVIAVAAFAFCACTAQWQYKTVDVEGVEYESYGNYFSRDFSNSDTLLNRMGAEGWELVSCYPITETVYPDLGEQNIILHIKTNTRTRAIRYVFKKKYNGGIL